MGIKLTNNAFGVLNAGIDTSATSIVLQSGQGARFPVLAGGDYFYATLVNTSNQLEIVKCTARSTDTLTIVRAQEGTTARSYDAGDRIELRITAQTFLDATELPANAVTTTGTQTVTNKTLATTLLSTNNREKTTTSAIAATGTIALNVLTQQVLYYTSNASGNFTVNIRGDGSTTLNSLMAVGDSITVAFLVTNGGTARYNTAVQVDGTGTGVTTRWQGGAAPTAGNASSVDSYTYTVIKTNNATFAVFASQSQFA
jgi:hypothetical protein